MKLTWHAKAEYIEIEETNRHSITLTPREASVLIKELTQLLRENVYCLECKGVGFDPPTGESCLACGGDGLQHESYTGDVK